ncbi:FUSC family protein [Granulicella sibirica]|uniref:Multidrug resistance protein MdtO n=1 Tax=Granulicella sibirica TaxID=2479048 RepID=A0A4V1L5X0_9BACT|nr:FUSC family protein [Granulicella sibirica]RXH57234.1 hypothetical protein GRAN_0544 [Granulicella sibirica]
MPAPPSPSWFDRLLQDLQPTPGRMNGALRVVLASVIALILLETLQMPFISIGLYFIFLVGRDSPAVSLRSASFSFAVVALAVIIEFAVVILTDNDPMARILSVALCTFLGAMLVAASSAPALGSAFGLIFCTVIGLWENHATADRLTKTSLYLLGTFSISLGCAVGVEYIFGDRNPADKLQQQRLIRYKALENMFNLYAQGAPKEQRAVAAAAVSRLAVAGQSGMMSLYNTIVERNLKTGVLPIALRVRITLLAQLMDVAAAFGLQNETQDDPAFRARCARIAVECSHLAPGYFTRADELDERDLDTNPTLLDRVEAVLHSILIMPLDLGDIRKQELVALPANKVPFFIPGALRSASSVAFALKISLCATLCYIIYHALDYPGISTCVTTVMVTGLSSTGAIKQKFVFRLLGAIIGGLILGLGAVSLFFPYMDSITSLVVMVIFIAFISAWTAEGPRFNYIGLQIAFSFYSVAFDGFTAPTELAPARDRLIGIMLALAVMWFVFDQIWPVRTVVVMRQGFASVLRAGASVFNIVQNDEPYDQLVRKADSLRDRVGKNIAGLRTMSESVEFDFGADRDLQMHSSELILRGAITAGALFWNQLAVLHSEADADFLTEPGLIAMRERLAGHLNRMADYVTEKIPFPTEDPAALVSPELLASARFGEYAQNTVARFDELQSNVCSMISLKV